MIVARCAWCGCRTVVWGDGPGRACIGCVPIADEATDPDVVRSIRAARTAGETPTAIARRLGMVPATVDAIAHGRMRCGVRSW